MKRRLVDGEVVIVRAHQVRVRVNQVERDRIVGMASEVALPVASYLRAVALGQSPRSARERGLVAAVFNINGDLGRLAGLLKWRLSDGQSAQDVRSAELRELLGELVETREALVLLAQSVRTTRANAVERLGEPWRVLSVAGKRSRSIHVPVRPDELRAVRMRSTEVRMPLSTYVRDRGLVFRPSSTLSEQAVAEMVELRDTANSLGGLVRLWITDDPKLAPYPPSQIGRTVVEALRRLSVLQGRIRILALGQIRGLGRAS